MLPDDELVGTDRTQEPADAQRKSFLGEGVEDAVSLTPLANQPGRLEHAEMTRDRRTADRESPGNLACRQLARPEFLQDLAARGVGKRAEGTCFLTRVDLLHSSFLALKLETKQHGGGIVLAKYQIPPVASDATLDVPDGTQEGHSHRAAPLLNWEIFSGGARFTGAGHLFRGAVFPWPGAGQGIRGNMNKIPGTCQPSAPPTPFLD